MTQRLRSICCWLGVRCCHEHNRLSSRWTTRPIPANTAPHVQIRYGTVLCDIRRQCLKTRCPDAETRLRYCWKSRTSRWHELRKACVRLKVEEQRPRETETCPDTPALCAKPAHWSRPTNRLFCCFGSWCNRPLCTGLHCSTLHCT